MGESITHDELLQALVDALQPQCDGDGLMTARELEERLGWSQKRTYRALRQLRKAGRLQVIMVRRTRLDGNLQWAPGYRLKEC